MEKNTYFTMPKMSLGPENGERKRKRAGASERVQQKGYRMSERKKKKGEKPPPTLWCARCEKQEVLRRINRGEFPQRQQLWRV